MQHGEEKRMSRSKTMLMEIEDALFGIITVPGEIRDLRNDISTLDVVQIATERLNHRYSPSQIESVWENYVVPEIREEYGQDFI
tara:strand:+ start:408 stop:659 length:252 start_codon:yes stop_codon:yes gene_type:complete